MNPGTRAATLLFVFALFVATAAQGQANESTSLLSIDDHGAVQAVGTPRISPDGNHVAFVFDDQLYAVPAAGGTPRAITSATSAASNPAWSRDGRHLYFLSDRSGSSQLWRLPVTDFGEAIQVTELERGVDALRLSPDEQRLLLVMEDAKEASDEPQPFVITRLQFKHDAGEGYLVERPSDHLYTVDLASGEVSQITAGDYAETEPAWSPDGSHVVFVSSRTADPDRTYGNNLWRVPTGEGTAEPERLTDDASVKGEPAYSPDGRFIAYLSAEDGVYGINRLTVIPATGGEPEYPAAALDRWVRDFRFSDDGRWIYLTYDQQGGTHVARVRLRDGRLERIIEGERVVSGMDLADDGTLVVRLNGANDADDIYRVRGDRMVRLTSMNSEFFASRKLGAKEKIRYTLDDGTLVEAFVTLPPDFEPGRQYPTILNIHGGPVGQFSWGYGFRTQMFAANGYVVVEPNPRGSTGRGQDFVRAIYRTWGITEYPDVVGAVDRAIELGYTDPDRLAVTGYSYGGYMTNVVITRTDRFKAAASGAGHSLIIANFGHDIYQKWYNWELGLPTEHRDRYDPLSPFLDAEKVTTPTLFLGGREDWNVPVLNAELFYQALRTRGIDTKLVVYPGMHHGGWTPRFEKDYTERVIDWFDRFVKADDGG